MTKKVAKAMEAVLQICCGVDIHKETAVACLMRIEDGEVKSEVRTFSTMTEGLLKLKTWLVGVGCGHVAVESTGVYWKPLFNPDFDTWRRGVACKCSIDCISPFWFCTHLSGHLKPSRIYTQKCV